MSDWRDAPTEDEARQRYVAFASKLPRADLVVALCENVPAPVEIPRTREGLALALWDRIIVHCWRQGLPPRSPSDFQPPQ